MLFPILGSDITFNLTIAPNNKGTIDILDEYILQPYDFTWGPNPEMGIKKYNAIISHLIKAGIVIPENKTEEHW